MHGDSLSRVRKVGVTLIVALDILTGGCSSNSESQPQRQAAAPPTDYPNAAYVIEGQRIKPSDVTRYFGKELKADLNDDGREDFVFVLTQQRGGSGTFFYVVA